MPYLEEFADLELNVGKVSVDIELPSLSLEDFAVIDQDLLADATLQFQPGVRYQSSSWPIDDLLKLYLTETAPDRLVFEPADVWLEVRGARGTFSITRLEAAVFIFRKSISEGHTLGSAVELAFETNSTFNLREALVQLIQGRLTTGLQSNGGQS
jgi:hypothetical protein